MYPKLRYKTTSRCVSGRAIFDKALDESSDRSSSDEDAEVPLAEDVGLQRQELAQRWMTQQSSPPRAFISSTSIDLPEYRQEVVDTCPTMGYMPLGMRHWPAQDATAEEVCLRKVDGTNVFIGIYAFRYGWIPPGRSVSITWLEYQRAVERKKPRLLFLMDENYTGWAPSKVETGEVATS